MSAATDPLAELVLPALLHKLGNHTQLLANLNTLLGIEGGAELALARGEDLVRASSSVRELGWVMAALASACGADMMLARRERSGLRVLAAFVQEALRRKLRDLHLPREPLPDLAPAAAGGWEVPWALCTLACERALGGPPGTAVDVGCERGAPRGWSLWVAGGVRAEAGEERVRAWLPGAEVESSPERTTLALPDAWLSPAPAA